MSNLEPDPMESISGATVATAPAAQFLSGREVVLGGTRGMAVTRTLPSRGRRMVGAWCFLDHFGPEHVAGRPGMRVPPHPHTALQTVTWLVAGEVRHRDSIGNDQIIRPGQLNLMTAGRGIAHAEDSPAEHGPTLHGVQLWVALPERHRGIAPDFTHHAELPLLAGAGVAVRVLMGDLASDLGDGRSPARTFSPIVAAEITLAAGTSTRLRLRTDFEYAVLALSGTVRVDDTELTAGPLLYLGRGRPDLVVSAEPPGGRVLLLGGEPFEERIVMWWNFIGAHHDDIVRARADWMAGRVFGEVRGYDGEPLPAPPMPATTLLPRGRER